MPAFLAFVTGALGSVLLLAATVLPWFRVPESRLVDGLPTIVGLEPQVTLVFKALCIFAVIGAWWIPRVTRHRTHGARVLALLLVALLFFPYLVMVWSPNVAARASRLQTQHASMSWLGGDIYGEQEIKDIDFKRHVTVADAEMPVAAFPLPDWAPSTVQWSRLPELIEWLGYSNSFCQFVNKGWFVALAGAAFALVPLLRGVRGFRFEACAAAAKTGVAGTAVGALVALAPLMATGSLITLSRDAVDRGDHAAALQWLHRAARVLPAIQQDSDFLAQQGLLESRLGMATPAAALHRAALLARQGFSERAQNEFAALLSGTSPDSAPHRAASSALLQSSIRTLNRGQSESAAATLELVLTHDPCNVKALYTLQLASLRTAQFDRVPRLFTRLHGIYRFYSTKTKAPVIASAGENSALAEYLRGETDEALALQRVSMGRPR